MRSALGPHRNEGLTGALALLCTISRLRCWDTVKLVLGFFHRVFSGDFPVLGKTGGSSSWLAWLWVPNS